jgi:hypothetical protein
MLPLAKDPGRVGIALALAAVLGLLLLALGEGAAEGARKQGAKPPLAGKYAGKVGTFARIIFNVRRRAVIRFNAGVKTNCQRSSDGVITETKNLATAPSTQEPEAVLKLKKPGRRWVFAGKAQDSEGVEWTIKGRFVSRSKAKGSFEASKFESLFNPAQPFGIDGQLCAGSGEWTAFRKQRR